MLDELISPIQAEGLDYYNLHGVNKLKIILSIQYQIKIVTVNIRYNLTDS
jgi:hypothetical protein